MRETLTALPRWQKRLLSIGFDTLGAWLCFFVAMVLRYQHLQWLNEPPLTWLVFAAVLPVCTLPFFIRMGLYRAVLRYINSQALSVMVKAAFLASLTLLAVDALLMPNIVLPRSVPFMYFVFLSVFMLGSRFFVQHWLIGTPFSITLLKALKLQVKAPETFGKPVLLVGHNEVLVGLVEVLHRGRDYCPKVLVDSSEQTVGGEIQGIPIIAFADIASAIEQFKPDEILLAFSTDNKAQRRQMIQALEAFALPIRSLPNVEDIIAGRVQVAKVQDVDIADVLGRDEVAAIDALLKQSVSAKSVLVSGAGGSIGSELLRQIITQQPKTIVLLDHSEFNLYQIEKEIIALKQRFSVSCELHCYLQSVVDETAVRKILVEHNVQVVYHAAAYKHVPLVEENPMAGFVNNVFGTIALAQAAMAANVPRFVFISTDKAVRPSNIMGASKRLAELVLQCYSLQPGKYFDENFTSFDATPSQTEFAMVRFGNVLGSSGSVIPLFREQIKQGGPITVTHPEITRYFMSMSEAAQLVIQAGSMAKTGDIFLLDMGQPVKIVELAKRMVSLSGLAVKDNNNDGDIEIVFTGLRPGEKLYEELLINGEPKPTEHPRIFKACEQSLAWGELQSLLQALFKALKDDKPETFLQLLAHPSVGYAPQA